MGLKHISLKYSNINVDAAMVFGRVLTCGHYHNLGSLDCYHAFADKQSLLAFLHSIKDLSFPAMHHLDVSGALMDEDCCIFFGEMMVAGVFPKLERLCMAEQQIHRSIWEALEVWSCPELRELVLSSAKLNSDSAAALASALTSGALSKLQRVDLKFARLSDGDDGDGASSTRVVNVLNALVSSCPDLRDLNATYISNMCEQAGIVIFDALRESKPVYILAKAGKARDWRR